MFSPREGTAAPYKLLCCLPGLLIGCTGKLTSPLIHCLSSVEWVSADLPTAGVLLACRDVVSPLPPACSPVVVRMQVFCLALQGTNNLSPCCKTWERKIL